MLMNHVKVIMENFNSFTFSLRLAAYGAFLFSMLMVSGCAFLQFGSSEVTPFEITPPMGVEGLTKSQVIARFGPPLNKITDEKGYEHWMYPNESYYYILLFGQGHRMNLILKFRNDKVIASRLIESGNTINILTQER
jgi:hypothetical protein